MIKPSILKRIERLLKKGYDLNTEQYVNGALKEAISQHERDHQQTQNNMSRKVYRPFRLHKSKDKQFYFTVVAKNGNVLATSETYQRKASVVKAILAVQRSCETLALPYLDLTTTE